MKNALILMMIVFTLPVVLMMVGKKLTHVIFKPFKGILHKLLKIVIVMAMGVGVYFYFTGKINF